MILIENGKGRQLPPGETGGPLYTDVRLTEEFIGDTVSLMTGQFEFAPDTELADVQAAFDTYSDDQIKEICIALVYAIYAHCWKDEACSKLKNIQLRKGICELVTQEVSVAEFISCLRAGSITPEIWLHIKGVTDVKLQAQISE